MHSKDIDWNDLRYVLVLAQHQTMVAAAEALRVHQTTISRRIVALEERLQTRLFDRIDGRFAPTTRGMIVVRRAQDMETARLALTDDLTHDPAHGRAVVRLSVIQTFVTGFLSRHLGAFPSKHPNIQLELICENRPSVLEHREADVAIRYVRPAQGHSMLRKIGVLGSAVYVHRELLRSGVDWCRDLPWIGFAQVADRWPEFKWIEANVPKERVALTVNGGPAYTALVARGYGAGILTCVEGDACPDLARVSGASPLITREIWLLVLPELRRNATIRGVLDWIAAVTTQAASALSGSASAGKLEEGWE
ncbi:MAG TPA: LysR family transcriptional regulator [Steroidobacteraceae bacterium]|jgi:DNA-binding transcriptional LysR family regulator|nr:LysR family transcriptional regulator [Steroidobacteraceae bacterium]